jgi:hypothetical protein
MTDLEVKCSYRPIDLVRAFNAGQVLVLNDPPASAATASFPSLTGLTGDERPPSGRTASDDCTPSWKAAVAAATFRASAARRAARARSSSSAFCEGHVTHARHVMG